MSATIALRVDQLDKVLALRGITTDSQLAREMGVRQSTVHRVRKGLSVPGPRFIAGLLKVAAPFEFDDLFTVTDNSATTAAA